MKILIAPDSFKGSVSAKEAAQAMKKGVHKVQPNADIHMVPMADGGEGTMIGLVEATGGTIHEVGVQDPFGRYRIGQYGVTGDGQTAIIELASASGLHTLTTEERDPKSASTYGSGQLVRDALKQGLRSFIICLGGSATNDAGSGLLKALGFQFLDAEGNELDPGGLQLKNLASIRTANVDQRVKQSSFQVACDVNNPFVGSNGASAVFGPQKGANQEIVEQLDGALKNFADVIEKQTNQLIHQMPGAGAAGGTAGGLLALFDAELKPGIKLVIETLQFERLFQHHHFDLLLTGEGKIDGQTASGKVVAGLAEQAKAYRVPTVALAGAVEGDLAPLYQKGLTTAFSIIDRPMTLEEAIANSPLFIEQQTERIFRLIQEFYFE